MPSFFRRGWFALLSASVFCLLQASVVHAFAVSPVLIDQTLDPGKSLQGTIRVINDTDQAQTYYASVQNFVPQGEEGQQQFLPETDTSGLASWISLDKTSFRLKSHEVQDFAWAIMLPQKAEPGGHYAAIFFSTLPQTNQDSSVGVGAKTGVLFLINVTGNIKEAATVESFHALSHDNVIYAQETSFFDRLPVNFELRVRNDGSVHVLPTGTIRITNMFGNTVATVPVNPSNGRVLPNSVRKVRSSWGPDDLPEQGGFFTEFQSEWKGFGLGRYTASADAAYGLKHQALAASVSFWIIPWRLLLAAFLALCLLVLFLKGYNRMVVKSAMGRAKGK
jgi:hypothetical protein